MSFISSRNTGKVLQGSLDSFSEQTKWKPRNSLTAAKSFGLQGFFLGDSFLSSLLLLLLLFYPSHEESQAGGTLQGEPGEQLVW